MCKLANLMRKLLLLSFSLGLFALPSCNTVKQYQRGMLAHYVMLPDRDPLAAGMFEHIRFSREASFGGGAVGGGGCGCN